MVLNWERETFWTTREEGRDSLGSWAVVQKRKCQIHIQGSRLGDLGWNTWASDKKLPHFPINLFSLWPFIARQESCQISQMNFLRPLHLFPLHLLPPSPPVICFPFPTMHQVRACKGHQWLYYCHVRWPLGSYSAGFLQSTWHFLLLVCHLGF